MRLWLYLSMGKRHSCSVNTVQWAAWQSHTSLISLHSCPVNKRKKLIGNANGIKRQFVVMTLEESERRYHCLVRLREKLLLKIT